MKSTLAIVSLALTIAFGAASALHARAAEPVYSTVYFSDASKTDAVGFTIEQCMVGDVVPGRLAGTQTAYFTSTIIYYCDTATGTILP